MGSWEYFVLSSYIFPIGTGLAFLIQKRLPFIGIMLWGFVLFTVCVEITGAVLAFNGINNLWLYRIYLFVELIFPAFFFFKQFSNEISKILLLAVLSLAIVFTTLSNIFDDWQDYASVQTAITFGGVAFIIIAYFIEMFRTEKVFNPFKDIYFVVGATLFIGHSCTLIYYLLYDYMVDGYFGNQIENILNGVNMGLVVFYNLLYSYALWISKRSQI
jgi:hypothetical protein